jgi:hypothetical protein
MNAPTGSIALLVDPSIDDTLAPAVSSHTTRTPIDSVRALPFRLDEVNTSTIGFDENF